MLGGAPPSGWVDSEVSVSLDGGAWLLSEVSVLPDGDDSLVSDDSVLLDDDSYSSSQSGRIERILSTDGDRRHTIDTGGGVA